MQRLLHAKIITQSIKMLIIFLTYSQSRLSCTSSLCNTMVFPLFCFQVPFHPLPFADQENGIYKKTVGLTAETKLLNDLRNQICTNCTVWFSNTSVLKKPNKTPRNIYVSLVKTHSRKKRANSHTAQNMPDRNMHLKDPFPSTEEAFSVSIPWDKYNALSFLLDSLL